MFVECHYTRHDAEREPVAVTGVEQRHRNWEQDSADDGAQGHETQRQKREHKGYCRNQHVLWRDTDQRSETRCDSFTALESEEHRIVVPDDRQQPYQYLPARIEVQRDGSKRGQQAFQHVECEDERARFRSANSTDIGRADVAAADGSDVHARPFFSDPEAEGQRTQQIARCQQEAYRRTVCHFIPISIPIVVNVEAEC